MRTETQNLVDHLAEMHPSRKQLERRLAEIGLGVLMAIQKGQMDFNQARTELLNLDNYVAIKRRRLSADLLEFFRWGMQLEDVAGIAPDGLQDSYAAMSRLAHRIIQSSWADGAHSAKAARKLRKSA